MMAVKLKWWRVGFVRVTDGVWGPTLGEGYRHKEWDIPCMRMVSSQNPFQASLGFWFNADRW